MKRLMTLALAVCLLVTGLACASEPIAKTSPATLETDDQKTLYAMGLLMAQQLVGYDISSAEVDIIVSGLHDGVLGNDPKVELEEFGPKIQAMLTPRAEAVAAREKVAGEAFCAEAAAKPGAVKTDKGVIYIEETAGTGESPGPDSTVKLHYHGTLRDGTVFDSSEGGEPAQFALNRVIPCFSEGLQKMKVGGKGRLVCPADQAYGDRGAPPKIRPGAAIAFDLELLEIVDAGAPAAPTD